MRPRGTSSASLERRPGRTEQRAERAETFGVLISPEFSEGFVNMGFS